MKGTGIFMRTVIFDLDGTLLDTLGDLVDATNYALRKMGFPERTWEDIRDFMGNGSDIYSQIGRSVPAGTGEKTLSETIGIYRERYSAHKCDRTEPFAGIREMLAALDERGFGAAVVSNKYDAAVREMCALYFPGQIAAALGEAMPERRKKPAPDRVYDAMELLGAKPSECVYVGDSEVDMETADNAGIPFIGCAWGYRGREFLIGCGASHVIDDPRELPAIAEMLCDHSV